MSRYILLLVLLIGTVFASTGPPPDGDGDDSDFRGLFLEFYGSCDKNFVVVKDQDGDPVNQAEVDVFDENALENILNNELTNESGIVTFEGCGRSVRIYASKAQYQPYNIVRDLLSCGECECNTNEDCTYNETCVDNACVPIECDCGEIVNYECLPYQCCSNADCSVGQTCINNKCEEGKPCTADGDCEGHQSCSNGKCEDLTGTACGIAVNHTWVDWECDRDCPCPVGEFCIEHECLNFEIDPEVVDNEIVVEVPEKCLGCGIDVVDPEGDKSNYLPDANGEVRIPVERSGRYLVALAKNGMILDKKDVDALLLNALPEEEKDIFQIILDNLLWFAVIVALALILLLFMIGRHREETHIED